MLPVWAYYTSALILFLLNASAVCASFVSLPGNWMIVLFSGLFAWLVQTDAGHGMSWWIVGLLAALAAGGELVEMLASSAGAAKLGASRRALVLSLVGSIAGSIVGVFVGLPVPIVGSAIAVVVFGAGGAFAGAVVGEKWKGSLTQDSVAIGNAAFWGRILGTVGKVAIGISMLVIATVDAVR